MSELLIYKASAGSGKTFTLAIEYIKQLVLYPRAYKQILAVTFTNKATAEMKERILSQLYGIYSGDAGSEVYLNRLIEDTGLSAKEIRNAAGEALFNMLHDYSHFRVETIDSFFQSVMRNLARELELSPSLNIELSQDEVLSDAVDSMIEKLQPTSPTMAWLLDYINERIADDKRWNVSDEIKKFGKNIFNEEFIEKGVELRRKLEDPNNIKEYKKLLNLLMKEAFAEMERYCDEFEQTLEAHALVPEDLKGGKNGIGSYFRKIRKGDLTDKTFNATAEKCLADANNWAAKTSPRQKDILSLANSSLISLLEQTEDSRRKHNITVNSCKLSLQHLNKLQLLANIDEEVRELNKENNRFLLSDTNALLHHLVKEDDSSFVFEKIGSSIRTVMIDEFQDTSRMQWSNFQMLLIEGLSQGANSLIVGDVKQSIYRWRNGDWGILNSLNDYLGNFPIKVKTLATNRRSETNIINFNNDFFVEAVNFLNEKHVRELESNCEPLLKAYRDVVQESPKTEDKGYVKVSFIEPDNTADYSDLTLESMAQEVANLLEQGVKLNDIAILVRKNKNIPKIAEYFDREMNCKIVSDEAFRLDASLAINMMINGLRFLTNPSDSIARAQLVLNYQNEVLQKSVSINELLLHTNDSYLPQAFISNVSHLKLMPLYELLEELFIIFQMELIKDQDAYLFSFFDAVMDYLQNNSPDINSFLNYWENKLAGKTIPSGEIEGIRIFSIHKSKGLEFHTVLMPFCDWKLENELPNQLVWCKPSKAPYNNIDIVPVSYSAQMAESVYRDDYLNERLQLWVDALNVLYVAFTRAGKNLIVWSKKGQKNTVSELLYNALPLIAEKNGIAWDEEEPYEFGRICPSEADKVLNITNKLLQKPAKQSIQMKSTKHEIKFRQSNRSADFIQGIDETESTIRFIDRGQMLHTLFSRIQTVSDIEPSIQQLVFEGIIGTREQEKEVRDIVQKAFAAPDVQDWYSGNWKLFNECSIIYREDGNLNLRRPDRVMMKDDRVLVIDFKFGKQLKKHKQQIQEYVDLLSRMGYNNMEGYLWYVDDNLIEKV